MRKLSLEERRDEIGMNGIQCSFGFLFGARSSEFGGEYG